MANPTAGDVHVNRPLTNISVAYMQDAMGFVADRVFPNIPVMKQSDRYFRYDRSDFWRNSFEKRAPSAESAGGGWKVDSSPNYFCHVWALHKDIDDQIRANADDPLNMDRDATIYLSQQGLISREVTWAAAYFKTGVWTTDKTGVDAAPNGTQVLRWNVAGSTPIEDVKANADAVQLLCGLRPNKLVIGRQVWTKLSDHAEIVDRVKYGGTNTAPAQVSRAAVASLFEIDDLLVMDGIQATNNENPTFEASLATSFIAGKNALLVYAAPQASILQPSGGYTFSWTGFSGAGGLGQRISRFRMDHLKSDRVEAEMAFDAKVVCPDAGVFLSTVIA